MRLHTKLDWRASGPPFVARIATRPVQVPALREREALILPPGAEADLAGYAAVFASDGQQGAGVIPLPPELGYLSDGDVVRIDPQQGDLWVWYRRHSRNNFLLLTERCNSRCLMCSQPPRAVDDSHLIGEVLEAIALISPETEFITLTGGEPTVLREGFLKILRRMKSHLPDTYVSVLTNGRSFAYRKLADRVAAVGHPAMRLCIPLYSDIDSHHDFVVQARGAFNQTVRGMMNLAAARVPVEIRVVLHRQTFERLPNLAAFIARNLPFVSHVALMGLEPTGFTKANMDALWMEPAEYGRQLEEAVETLRWAGLSVSIYNHPLCLVPRALWPYCRQSISDWKNIYFEECEGCTVKGDCCGFFASATLKRSNLIRPVLEMSPAP